MLSEIIFLILGIIGGLIPGWLKKLYDSYKAKQSHQSGRWRTFIYDKNDKIIKEDILHLKHNPKTGEFKGTIKRDIPKEQRHRNWIFKGVFAKEAMLMVFWSKDEIPSYGVEYLVLVDDFTYQGYYLKHEKDISSPLRGDIERVKIVNKKIVSANKEENK